MFSTYRYVYEHLDETFNGYKDEPMTNKTLVVGGSGVIVKLTDWG